MTDNNSEKRTLDLPNVKLKFFAYGIFKSGQLAYSKIRRHVNEKELTYAEIPCEMKLRDGVPILTGKESRHPTQGVLITFREGHEERAYQIICKNIA